MIYVVIDECNSPKQLSENPSENPSEIPLCDILRQVYDRFRTLLDNVRQKYLCDCRKTNPDGNDIG